VEKGYAVIFLTRDGSIQPFQRKWERVEPTELFNLDHNESTVSISAKHNDIIFKSLQLLQEAIKNNKFLKFKFRSIHEYLYLLREISQLLAELGPNSVILAAAAVSDFYIPFHEMSEHKIQSINGPLTIQLQQVPKILGLITSSWAPKSFLVTFKLETDPSILEKKSLDALNKYHHKLVIGNLLNNYRDTIRLISPDHATLIISRNEEEKN